jgi:hypothetical protein
MNQFQLLLEHKIAVFCTGQTEFLPDESFGAIITDPPEGMGGGPLLASRSVVSGVCSNQTALPSS